MRKSSAEILSHNLNRIAIYPAVYSFTCLPSVIVICYLLMSYLMVLQASSSQPLVVTFCFFCAWVLILLIFWSTWTVIKDTVDQAAQLHQIPCAKCQFFTRNYYLKCTVHPSTALSEAAIDCPDFQVITNPYTASSSGSSQKLKWGQSHRSKTMRSNERIAMHR